MAKDKAEVDPGLVIPPKEGTVAMQIWPSARKMLKNYKELNDFDNMSEALIYLVSNAKPKKNG